MQMVHRPQVEDDLYEVAEEIREEYGYGSIDAALKHIAREAGYNV